MQFDLFTHPAIERSEIVPRGFVFHAGGRALKVYRVTATDARAPVIVEELASFGSTLAGQYGLWSYDAVLRAVQAERRQASWRK